jgi:serine protease Do
VVTIQALDASGQLMASGTGFFVTGGYVVTAAHVLEGAAGCRIELTDGQQQRCSVAASDSVKDVTMLTVSGTPPATLRWGVSEAVKDGDDVTVISNPLGQLPGTISRGIVSASRVVNGTKLLQISAPISHGSSGAPVLNVRGQVVGIVRSTIEAGQALNFATATDAIRNLNNDQVAVAEGQTLLTLKSVIDPTTPGGQGAGGRSNTSSPANLPRIRIGQTINGSLTSSDSLYPDTTYFKFYEFTTTPGRAITIDLSSSDFDPVLIIRGDDLAQSILNDDGGPGCAARVSRTFPGRGPYRILVNTTARPERQTGRFSLSITQGSLPARDDDNARCIPAGAAASTGGERSIDVGQSQQGTLTRNDVLLDSDSTYAQPWTIQGRAGQTITIDLESDAFDAYLFLRGPGISGGRDFQDDDSGGNCQARLTATLPQTGEYQIVVNTADHYATGSFSLSVTSGSKPKSVARCRRSSQ